jgi:hypothetical protein
MNNKVWYGLVSCFSERGCLVSRVTTTAPLTDKNVATMVALDFKNRRIAKYPWIVECDVYVNPFETLEAADAEFDRIKREWRRDYETQEQIKRIKNGLARYLCIEDMDS